jgi:hypothetical protein
MAHQAISDCVAEDTAVNVITTTDGPSIASLISSITGASDLSVVRDDVRIARWALEMARLERANVWRYRGANAVQFRRELARRINRCITKVSKAQRALSEAETLTALRRAEEARQATMTTQQVQLCINRLRKNPRTIAVS